MEEENENLREFKWTGFVLNYGIYIIIILFWIFFHGKFGNYSTERVTVWTVITMGGIFGFKGMWDAMRNDTPKFVFNDGWDTIDPGRVPIEVGNFAIIVPSIKAWNMYWEFKSPTYVTSLDAIRQRGRNLVANVHMEPVSYEELPLQIRGKIVEMKLKPPYYLGLADVDQYEILLKDKDATSGLERPSVAYLIQQVKEDNKMNSMLLRYLGESYNMSEERIASLMRMAERMKPSQITEMIKRQFVEEKT